MHSVGNHMARWKLGSSRTVERSFCMSPSLLDAAVRHAERSTALEELVCVSLVAVLPLLLSLMPL